MPTALPRSPRLQRAVPLLAFATLFLASCSDESPVAATPEPATGPSLYVSGGTVGYLGTLGGGSSHPYDMNDAGYVVGASDVGGGRNHAFLHSPAGGMQDLGTFGNAPGRASEARAINRAGLVTGHSQLAELTEFGWAASHAFRWRPSGGMEDLGTLGGFFSGGTDINNAGQVVGWAELPRTEDGEDLRRAFIHSPGGAMVNLGTFGGRESFAVAVNNTGVVVGWANAADGVKRAFRWTAGGGLQDLGSAPGVASEAVDVNDAGQVLVSDGQLGAVIHSPGAPPRVITHPGGYAIRPVAINSRGEIAGWLYMGGAERAVRWTPAGGVQDLGTLGGSRAAARDINDGGDVTGWSWTSSTSTRAFIWTQGGGMRELAGTADYYGVPAHHGLIINNSRQVAGTGRNQAIRWAPVWTETAPEITSISPYLAYEGAAVRFTPAISNVDGDKLTYEWTFGDGTTSNVPAPSKRYDDNGLYEVRLIVRDPGGLADTATATAEVRNARPWGGFYMPGAAVEGRPFTLGFGSVADQGITDRASLTVAINCGSGFGAYSSSLTGTCQGRPDQGTVTVKARVKDKDGAIREYSGELAVSNAVPVAQLTATSPTTIAPGGSVAFDASFTDYGTLDGPWSWRITWGDGAVTAWTGASAQGALPAQGHAYAAPGTYTARLWVVDKDGAQHGSTRVTITVQ
ncbi:PKD domain-containing protein [Longimicrobium sp.]|jgi:probable HAF family extracellular repeat protein|uniref:PKD domain-containing protein n=1 Tax=Longimicrobium sp. TaxID=2029185 RepID=UPI002ED95AA9